MKLSKTVRIIVLILSAVMLVSIFAGCKNAYTDEELAVIITPLLEKEAELNGYIYGTSFETELDPGEDADKQYSKYYEVKKDSKYKSCDEFKSGIREVFAKDTAESIFVYAFEGTSEMHDGGASVTARFGDSNEGFLQIDVTKEPYDLRGIVHIETARVKRATKRLIKAEVEFSRFSSDGKETVITKIVELVNENGEWKLDSQTFAIGTTK